MRIHSNIDVDETEDLVFGGPCEIVEGVVYNGHSAATFLKIYDAEAVADVVVGTTVPKMVIGIPATSQAVIPRGRFVDGIVVACTLNATLADATDPVVGAVLTLSTA